MSSMRQEDREPQCSQSWEVEAARDGRLSGEAVEAVARHLDHCEECRERADYFTALGQALRRLEQPRFEPARLTCLRRKLLKRLDSEILDRPSRRSSSWRGPGLVAAAIIMALVAWRWPRTRGAELEALNAQRIEPVREHIEKPVAVALPPSAAPSPTLPSPTHPKPGPISPVTPKDVVDASPNGSDEDVAYLRTLGLLREGRNEEARLAAKEYLERFPNGFRHEEVKKIAEP